MSAEFASAVAYRRLSRTQALEREIAGLAGLQYGVVSRGQLEEIGLSGSAVDRRIRAGRLLVLHPGVFAVGHAVVSREGRWLAAVLRGGEGAVLSHRSAAALWGIRNEDRGIAVEISTPRRSPSRPAIRRHRVLHVPGEATVRRRIPVTTLARTLLDLSSGLTREGLEAAIREAEYRHRFDAHSLRAMLESHPGHRGAAKAKSALASIGLGPRGRTRSRLEVRFAAFLARTDLPKPRLNVLIDLDGEKIEADCLWHRQKLIVELDGGDAHGTRSAFESDRERDRRLQVVGWRVVRVTWRQMNDPIALRIDLRRLLECG